MIKHFGKTLLNLPDFKYVSKIDYKIYFTPIYIS